MYVEQRRDGAMTAEEGVFKECSFFNSINYKSIVISKSVYDIHSPIKQATTKIS